MFVIVFPRLGLSRGGLDDEHSVQAGRPDAPKMPVVEVGSRLIVHAEDVGEGSLGRDWAVGDHPC